MKIIAVITDPRVTDPRVIDRILRHRKHRGDNDPFDSRAPPVRQSTPSICDPLVAPSVANPTWLRERVRFEFAPTPRFGFVRGWKKRFRRRRDLPLALASALVRDSRLA